MATNVDVEIQQTAGHAALAIPRERLEAWAMDVAQTGIDQWGIEDTPRSVVLQNQWGDIETNIIVRRLSAKQFHCCFLTRDELDAVRSRDDDDEQ